MARKRQHDEMTSSTLDVVDKLAHTIKNLCKIIDDMEGYSERMSYENSMRRGSYARGRGRNARRDSMGRYSSGNEMMMEQLQDLMEESPDDRTRQEIQKLMSKLG